VLKFTPEISFVDFVTADTIQSRSPGLFGAFRCSLPRPCTRSVFFCMEMVSQHEGIKCDISVELFEQDLSVELDLWFA
jgi:hypothetical protein